MSEGDVFFVCVSVRGSERVATTHGRRLDEVQHREPGFERLRAWLLGCRRDQPQLDRLMDSQGATAVLCRQVAGMFDLYGWSQPAREVLCEIALDSVSGTFAVAGWSAWHGSCDTLEGIEGDDLVFVVGLRRTAGDAAFSLRSRPATPALAMKLLAQLSVLPEAAAPDLSSRFRPGFYLVRSECDPWSAHVPAATAPSWDNWLPAMCVFAYLFRCYLVCQRTERLLLEVRSNGDRDEEYRKLLLARKKIISSRKSALLKNRAAPGSILLRCFFTAMSAFRLQEQLDHLVGQAEELVRVLEAQSIYVATKRIQSIQAIVFASTVLGLAVALNAIQMPPFYSGSTANALGRPVFWIVVGIVVGGGLAIWFVVTRWSEVLRGLRRFRARIGSSK